MGDTSLSSSKVQLLPQHGFPAHVSTLGQGSGGEGGWGRHHSRLGRNVQGVGGRNRELARNDELRRAPDDVRRTNDLGAPKVLSAQLSIAVPTNVPAFSASVHQEYRRAFTPRASIFLVLLLLNQHHRIHTPSQTSPFSFSRRLRVLCECGMSPCGGMDGSDSDSSGVVKDKQGGMRAGNGARAPTPTPCRLLATVEDEDGGPSVARLHENVVECQRVSSDDDTDDIRVFFGLKLFFLHFDSATRMREKFRFPPA